MVDVHVVGVDNSKCHSQSSRSLCSLFLYGCMSVSSRFLRIEKFEDIKGPTRDHKSKKDRQCNYQKKVDNQ
jgi:hypothetical protein